MARRYQQREAVEPAEFSDGGRLVASSEPPVAWPAFVRIHPRTWPRLAALRKRSRRGRGFGLAEAEELSELERTWFAEQWPRWRRPQDLPGGE